MLSKTPPAPFVLSYRGIRTRSTEKMTPLDFKPGPPPNFGHGQQFNSCYQVCFSLGSTFAAFGLHLDFEAKL